MIQFNKEKIIVANNADLLLLCTMPAVSHASPGIESILKAASSYLTGGIAKAAATLCIIGAGYLTLYTQKLSKEWLVAILIGCGFIFGASELINKWIK